MLLNPTAQDIEYLTNLISNRIDQGRGETLFEIGLEGKNPKALVIILRTQAY